MLHRMHHHVIGCESKMECEYGTVNSIADRSKISNKFWGKMENQVMSNKSYEVRST